MHRPREDPALGDWRARIRRWLRPPRVLRPTRAGWYFTAICFGVGFAALNTGNNLLYLVLSLMLAFLVLSGVLSESALRGIQVRRRIPSELYAEADNPIAVEIHNAQRRVPSFAIVIEDRLRCETDSGGERDETRAAGRTFALRVGAGETETRRYQLRPERRGALEFAGFRVSTRFPFGLFLKSLRIESPAHTLVYPAIERLRVPPTRRATHAEGEEARGGADVGADATGLREFEDGDSLRRVHWRSSLRRGALVVRELDDEREREVEVQLRTALASPGRGAGGALRERFEERVRWAASEVVAHLESGLRVGLRTDGEQLGAATGNRQRRRLLAFLARVEPDAPTPPRAAST